MLLDVVIRKLNQLEGVAEVLLKQKRLVDVVEVHQRKKKKQDVVEVANAADLNNFIEK